MEKKNVVLVGYGGMGHWHVDKLLKSDVCNLKGIYDIDPIKVKEANNNGLYSYDSLEQIANDDSVEIVTVAIPNDVHESVVIDLLKSGKNVICEKPVALSVDSLQKMIDCANLNHVKFSVHQNRRWDVDFLAIQKLKTRSKIGEFINLESRIHGSRGIPSDWRGKKEHGGGMLLDWGIHLIDQVLQLMDGKIVKLYCTFDHITNQEVDDGFKLDLYFENKSHAYIEVGTYNFIELPRFYVQGKNGTAIINNWKEKCKYNVCKYWHESEVLPIETAAGLTKTMAPRDGITLNYFSLPIPTSDVHDYYRNFCNAIDGIEDQYVTHSQMIRDIKVIEAAFESVRLCQVINVNL